MNVRIHNAGLCHSDVSRDRRHDPVPDAGGASGHEGAGVVEEVGERGQKVKVGDHVVLTTLGNCGQCDACDRGQPTHCRDTFGKLPRPFTVGGDNALPVRQRGRVQRAHRRERDAGDRDRPTVPLDVACLIGCAVVTGTGAVLNRAKVQPGQSVVVIGAGGIGQSVIQAARIAAAGRIIVVDANPAKEAVARQFGATDFIDGAPPTTPSPRSRTSG